MVNLCLTLSRLGSLFGGDLKTVITTAAKAEQAGVDTVVVTDHVVIGRNVEKYPYGSFTFSPEEPWPEPLTMLTAMAATTERVRLATGILISSCRPAVLLAKTVATLDALSGGRVDLGLGTGWQREEIEACGAPMSGRTARLEDTIAVCRTLWSGGPVSIETGTVSFHDLWSYPVPVQSPLPIWLAGPPSPPVLDRIARLAEGWLPMPSHASTTELPECMERYRQALMAAGRKPEEARARVNLGVERDADGAPDLGKTLEVALPRLVAAGVTHPALSLGNFITGADGIDAFFAELGRRWPAVAS